MNCWDVVFSNTLMQIFDGWKFTRSLYDVVVYDKQYDEIFENNAEDENNENGDNYNNLEYHVKVCADTFDPTKILHIAKMKLDVYLSEESFSNQDPEDDYWDQKRMVEESQSE
jgi:hypothetical protein